ncbi:MAG: hypothetical protein L6V88_09185 [Anaerotruncus sp.]|nr:MAG: hypothetical protein L6V88_09185 [Anaerotruncus sp.]
MAVFVGHDHKNSFVGRYKNVDLGFTQSSGFNVYGNRTKRGVRIIELDENKPGEYETYTRTFDELVGTKVQKKPVYDYLSSKAPETVDAAIPMIEKALAIIAAIVAVIILLVKFLYKNKGAVMSEKKTDKKNNPFVKWTEKNTQKYGNL